MSPTIAMRYLIFQKFNLIMQTFQGEKNTPKKNPNQTKKKKKKIKKKTPNQQTPSNCMCKREEKKAFD